MTHTVKVTKRVERQEEDRSGRAVRGLLAWRMHHTSMILVWKPRNIIMCIMKQDLVHLQYSNFSCCHSFSSICATCWHNWFYSCLCGKSNLLKRTQLNSTLFCRRRGNNGIMHTFSLEAHFNVTLVFPIKHLQFYNTGCINAQDVNIYTSAIVVKMCLLSLLLLTESERKQQQRKASQMVD